MKTFMMTAAVAGLLIFGQAQAAELESLKLKGGTEVEGSLEVRDDGVLYRTESGGAFYRWAKIDPASLPEDLREQRREYYVERLLLAQSYYDGEQYAAAAKLFAEVDAHETYLADEDLQLPAWRGIAFKKRGLIEQDGKWLSQAAIKAQQGLYAYDGQWMTREQIKVASTYKAAFAKARGDDIPGAIVALKAATAAYPDAPYAAAADLLVERLVAKAVEPQPTPAPTPEPRTVTVPQPAATPQYVPEREYGTRSYTYSGSYLGTRSRYYGYYDYGYTYPVVRYRIRSGNSHHGGHGGSKGGHHGGHHGSKHGGHHGGSYINLGSVKIRF